MIGAENTPPPQLVRLAGKRAVWLNPVVVAKEVEGANPISCDRQREISTAKRSVKDGLWVNKYNVLSITDADENSIRTFQGWANFCFFGLFLLKNVDYAFCSRKVVVSRLKYIT